MFSGILLVFLWSKGCWQFDLWFVCLFSTQLNIWKFSVHVLLKPAAAAAAAKSLQSCPTLCDPIDGSPPGSPIPGILQARTLEWVAISFSNAWKRELSRVWLFETPWTVAYQAPPSKGVSRQEYWSGLPLPSPIWSVHDLKKNCTAIISWRNIIHIDLIMKFWLNETYGRSWHFLPLSLEATPYHSPWSLSCHVRLPAAGEFGEG